MSTNKNQTNTGTYDYKQTKLVDLLSLSNKKDFFSQPYQFYVSLEDVNFKNQSVQNRSIWISNEKVYSPKSDIVPIILHSSTYKPENFETNKTKKGSRKRKGKGKTVIDHNGRKKKTIKKLKLKPKQMAKEREKEKKRLLERPLGILISFKFLKSIPSSYVMHRQNGIRSRYSTKPTQYPVIIEKSELVLKESLIPKQFLIVQSTKLENINAPNFRKRHFETEHNICLDVKEKTKNYKIRKTLNKMKKSTSSTPLPPKDKLPTQDQDNNFSKSSFLNSDLNNNDNIFNITLENVDTKFVNIQQPCVINVLNQEENYTQNLNIEGINSDFEFKPLNVSQQNIEEQNEKENILSSSETEFVSEHKDTKATQIVNNGNNLLSAFHTNILNLNNFISEDYFSPSRFISTNVISHLYQGTSLNTTSNIIDYDYEFNTNSNSSTPFDNYFINFFEYTSQTDLQLSFIN
ncbi:hypothetical protein M0813_15236 [Anaeramoeba flamelloides]|uniref:Uncharacterized protein n=1 Tax=Anaeramoeba flamelloides TaxID=1746091 RepID=A0ABQ8Z2V9_9EUKA|nr:hypothetical protein M0813_15236 [Anaeramoeba flamelloides]